MIILHKYIVNLFTFFFNISQGCNLCTKRSTKANSKQNTHATQRHKAHAQSVEQKALATHHAGQNEEAFEETLEVIAPLDTFYKTNDSIIFLAVNCNEPPFNLKLHSISERCSIDKSKLNRNVSPTRCKWPREWISCHVALDGTNRANHCRHICQELHFSCISLRFRYSFYIKHNFLLVHIFYGFYERLHGLVAVKRESSTNWNSFSDARLEFLEHGIDIRLMAGKVLFLLLHIRLHCITHEFKQIIRQHQNWNQLRVPGDRKLRQTAASSQSAVKLTRHKATVAPNLLKISKQTASTGKPQARKQHDLHHRKFVFLKHHLNAIFFIIVMCMPILSTASVHNIKYSTNVVKTKYGPLRGILLRSNPAIEAYLGVPYATPPVGSLR